MIETFNSNPEDIIVGIAPSIGSCCYEVGKDVAQHFLDVPNAFEKKEHKYMLDPTLYQQAPTIKHWHIRI